MTDKHRKWLKENDLQLFMKNAKVKATRARCELACGSITSREFLELRREVCVFWKTWKRRALSRTYALTNEQWDALQLAVKRLQRELGENASRVTTADQVAKLLCGIKHRANDSTVRGLSKRFHWWEETA